jgi:hypothetical protein
MPNGDIRCQWHSMVAKVERPMPSRAATGRVYLNFQTHSYGGGVDPVGDVLDQPVWISRPSGIGAFWLGLALLTNTVHK